MCLFTAASCSTSEGSGNSEVCVCLQPRPASLVKGNSEVCVCLQPRPAPLVKGNSEVCVCLQPRPAPLVKVRVTVKCAFVYSRVLLH